MRLGADGVLKCSGQRASDMAHQQLTRSAPTGWLDMTKALRAPSWKAPHRPTAETSKRRRPRHRRSGGALGAWLARQRSRATTTRGSPAASDAAVAAQIGGAGNPSPPQASLTSTHLASEVGSTRMESEDALPARRRVARMTKARRGRDAPGSDCDRQPGRRRAVRRTEAARRGKRFGPSRGNVAMRQIQAWRLRGCRRRSARQVQPSLARDQGYAWGCPRTTCCQRSGGGSSTAFSGPTCSITK
jgi:hypothetical protein